MPAKTRAQLELEGTLLEGVIVADWFKENCDGCSASIFKKYPTMRQLESACIIHDAEYTFIPVSYPLKSKGAKNARKLADKRLLRNCKLIIGARGKHPIRRFTLSRAVYYVVRLCGSKAVVPLHKKAYRMPRTTEQLAEFMNMVYYVHGATGFGKAVMSKVLPLYVDGGFVKDFMDKNFR